jgi:hypothetical protein
MEVGEQDGGYVAQGDLELPQALCYTTAAIKEQCFCTRFDQGAWTEPLNARARSAGAKQDNLNHIISLSIRAKA